MSAALVGQEEMYHHTRWKKGATAPVNQGESCDATPLLTRFRRTNSSALTRPHQCIHIQSEDVAAGQNGGGGGNRTPFRP
jgi:hypothetical protein